MSIAYGSFDMRLEDFLPQDEPVQPDESKNQPSKEVDLIEVSREQFNTEFGIDINSLFSPMEEESPSPSETRNQEFLEILPEDVRKLIENEENPNTLKKTLYDCSKFERFLAQKGENQPMAKIEPEALDEYLANFILSIKKSDGEDYEPTSIRNIISSIDRKLKRQKYPHRIIGEQSSVFQLSRDALKAKQKSLKRLGKGNKPKKSSPITDEEINMLYEKDILGRNNSKALLNTIWMNNCIQFGLRGTKENYNLRWGDITLKKSSDGLEYLELTERQTKTRTGANVTDVREITPKIFATPADPDRCPVETYKLYMAKRPQDFCESNHPFYISPRTSSQRNSNELWFMKSVVGERKIGELLKKMAVDGGLDASKRLTNHSTRKHLVQKLRDAGIAPTDIMQISGHKNIQSVMNYSAMSEQKHKECSTILSSRSKPPSTVTCLGENESTITEIIDPLLSDGQKDTNVKESATGSSNIRPQLQENLCINLPHPVSQQPRAGTTCSVENPPLFNQETLRMNTMLSSVFSGAVLNIQNCNINFYK